MILADTSVWIDHLRAGNETLAALLDAGRILAHPFVIGELALGNMRNRETVLKALADLPQARVATNGEVLHFIERQALAGRGIGYIDAHLLASTRLSDGAELWTSDKRLHAIALQLGMSQASAQHPGSN